MEKGRVGTLPIRETRIENTRSTDQSFSLVLATWQLMPIYYSCSAFLSGEISRNLILSSV